MATYKSQSSSIAKKSLCDIDYAVTLDLMRAMDFDDGWEILASKAKYSAQQVLRLKDLRNRAHGSPTSNLLWELGCDGYNVLDLYERLKEGFRKREMQILEEYVRRNNEQPLSRLASGAVADTKKEAAEEEKHSVVSSQDLDSILSQIKIPGSSVAGEGAVASAPQLNGDSSINGGGGSAVNFNKPSLPLAQSRSDHRQGGKHYGEKFIPGTEQQGVVPDFASSKSGYISAPRPNRQPPTESEDPQSIPSFDLESSIGPSASRMIAPSISNPEAIYKSLKASFTYRELCEATGNFSDDCLIGQGAFGRVYKGTLKHQDCAIKRLNSSDMEYGTNMKQVMSELAMLLEYSHENVVLLYGYALDGQELCLVYQHLANGSLEDRLLLKNGTRPLTWERRLNILVGACKGLNFLHTKRDDKPLIHGDIKSANILLDQNLEAKLADLGHARYATGGSMDTKGFTHVSVIQAKTKVFGTKAYHAPEVLSSGQLSVKSDVYAMGVVFLEVCSGLPAYDPNRIMGHFLTGVFQELGEDQWISSFKDRTLERVPNSSFEEVLTLAIDCVKEIKKKRPKTVKLMKKVKECYSNYVELLSGANGHGPVVTSPAQSSQHHHIGELQKKFSDTALGEIVTSVSANPYYPSTPGSRIAADQEEILRQRTSLVQQGPRPQIVPQEPGYLPQVGAQTPDKRDASAVYTQREGSSGMGPQPSMSAVQDSSVHFYAKPHQHPQFGSGHQQFPHPQLQQQQYQWHQQNLQPDPTLEPCTLQALQSGKSPAAVKTSTPGDLPPVTSESNHTSLDAQVGDSIPLRLQQAFDHVQAMRERLQQEGYENLDSLSRELLSQELEEIRQNQSTESYNANQSTNTEQSEHQSEEDYFPKPDPKKLEQLFAFDSANFSGDDSGRSATEHETSSPALQSDPKKLALLQQFDEHGYQPSPGDPIQGNPTVSSSSSTCSRHVENAHFVNTPIPAQSTNQTPVSGMGPNFNAPAMSGNEIPQSFIQLTPVVSATNGNFSNPQFRYANSGMILNNFSPTVVHDRLNNSNKPFQNPEGMNNQSGHPEVIPGNDLASATYFMAGHHRKLMKEKFSKECELDALMADIASS